MTTSQDWSALGTMLLGAGVIIGGFWTLFNYRRARRAEAVHWMNGVFADFYLKDTFDDIRELLEYKYAERAAPLIELRLTDRDVHISSADVALLRQLDTLLNYFEYVLYLENEKQISRSDRLAIFEYWFDIMRSPNSASLRRYVARFGFERVAKELVIANVDYVAVYGSLRKGFGLPDLPSDLSKILKDRGPCVIAGRLYDLGDYPGLRIGRGEVVGELFQVLDAEVAFQLLDQYERYSASKPQESLFVRRYVRLIKPKADAWIYIVNAEPPEESVVVSGDWAKELREREKAQD